MDKTWHISSAKRYIHSQIKPKTLITFLDLTKNYLLKNIQFPAYITMEIVLLLKNIYKNNYSRQFNQYLMLFNCNKLSQWLKNLLLFPMFFRFCFFRRQHILLQTFFVRYLFSFWLGCREGWTWTVWITFLCFRN